MTDNGIGKFHPDEEFVPYEKLRDFAKPLGKFHPDEEFIPYDELDKDTDDKVN